MQNTALHTLRSIMKATPLHVNCGDPGRKMHNTGGSGEPLPKYNLDVINKAYNVDLHDMQDNRRRGEGNDGLYPPEYKEKTKNTRMTCGIMDKIDSLMKSRAHYKHNSASEMPSTGHTTLRRKPT